MKLIGSLLVVAVLVAGCATMDECKRRTMHEMGISEPSHPQDRWWRLCPSPSGEWDTLGTLWGGWPKL